MQLKMQNLEVLAYSMNEGSDQYRTKIAQYYAKNDIQVAPEDIIVTTGGSEALSFHSSWEAILDPEDEIIIPEPFYANYNGFATAAAVKVVPISFKN